LAQLAQDQQTTRHSLA